MQIEAKKDQNIIFVNTIICFALVLLSLIGLCFGEYAVILCTAICGMVSVISTFLFLKSGNSTPEQGLGTKFAVFTLLRYILMIVGLVLSALCVLFTMGEEVNKYRYLMVAIGAVQYLITPIVLTVMSR